MTTTRNEVKALRAYTKFPGSDKLRKGASADLRHLVAVGWHEVSRQSAADHMVIRLERQVTAQPQVQTRRRDESDGGGGGGGGNRGGGGGNRR